MSTILVPIDFSENSINALNYAVEIARNTGSKLLLFNSYNVAISAGLNTPPIEYLEAITVERQKDHTHKLQQLADRFKAETYALSGKPMEFRVNVMIGLATDMIEEMADTESVDLIVMGTKGATGLAEALWGSITANVIKRVDVPILAVPEEASYQPIQKLVYATDFDEEDEDAIDELQRFCKHFDATLTCLHISQDGGHKVGDQKRMKELETSYWFTPAKNLNFELIDHSNVEKGLENYLKTTQADILAVMPHHRSFIDNLFHKSITRKLALHSKIPLLVMKG